MRSIFGWVVAATLTAAPVFAQDTSREQQNRQRDQQQTQQDNDNRANQERDSRDVNRGDSSQNRDGTTQSRDRRDSSRQTRESQTPDTLERIDARDRTERDRLDSRDRDRDRYDSRYDDRYRDRERFGERWRDDRDYRYRDEREVVRYRDDEQRHSTDRGRLRGWTTDSQIIALIAADNQTEIAVANLAADRADSDDVAEFAERLIDDHSHLMAQLRDFDPRAVSYALGGDLSGRDVARGQTTEETRGRAYESDRGRSEDSDRRPSRSTFQDDRGRISSRIDSDSDTRFENRVRVGGGDLTTSRSFFESDGYGNREFAGMGLDFVTIKREIAQRHRESMEKAMDELEGWDLDMAFVSQQIGSHMHMIDVLTVLQKHASRELRPILQDALESARQHLEEAKDLKAQLNES